VKIAITLLILQKLLNAGMTISVDFKNERPFRTIEVHNVWPDAMLPSELKALKLA